METKTVHKFLYDGIGFPIELEQVKLVKFDGEWIPQLDIRNIADMAIKALVTQKEAFTGNQVHFIRTYFSMNLRDFAKILGVTHTAANKWEKCGDEVTSMHQNIEKMLRLYIYDKVCVKTVARKKDFYQMYLQIRNAPLLKKRIKFLHVECVV